MAGKLQHSWMAALAISLGVAGASQAAEPPSFSSYVAQGYREITFFALNETASPAIAAHFASRAQLADVEGTTIEPEAVNDGEVDRKLAAEARPARQQLMDRLSSGVQWTSPLTSAIAVINFDCWVEFASADGAGSAECRRRFFAALQTLPAHPAPAPEVPAGATTILIALRACAVPPWLGDCPMAADAPASPGHPAQRHASSETGSGRTISALAGSGSTDSLAPISALADGQPVTPPPANASLAETIGPAPADAPAD